MDKNLTASQTFLLCMDFLTIKGRQMKAEYAKRMRENNEFNYDDLKSLQKEINDKINFIIN